MIFKTYDSIRVKLVHLSTAVLLSHTIVRFNDLVFQPRAGAGRAAFRGAAGDVGDVTRAMGDVSVGGGSGQGQGQENFQFLRNLRYLDYDDIRTKPAHIENKAGTGIRADLWNH